MYTFYADNVQFTEKPSAEETALINKRLHENTCDYRTLADNVGELGITFTVASFYHKRISSDFRQEQLFALDFDSGITFLEIKKRADNYHLPFLFAYKTFSWSPEHEKFRIVMGFSHVVTDLFTARTIILILMTIFPECDKKCKDPSRMFYGGKGLLYLNEENMQFSPEQLFLSFDEYMRGQYGQKHYTEHIRKFYSNYHVMTDKKGRIPVTETAEDEDRSIFIVKSEMYKCVHEKSDFNDKSEKCRRLVIKNFDWNALYDCCELFRNFCDGKEYYYYPELFHIALNLCIVDGGRRKFIEILHSTQNQKHDSYFDDSKTDWKNTLNDIIKHGYLPQNCIQCPYAEKCNHSINMISTAKPCRHDVKLTEPKEYCTIEEAEESLAENFHSALNDRISNKIKLVIAQTGLGKTRMYLDMLMNASEKFMIVVPTHNLKDEIYNRAVNMGIRNIVSMPRLPILSQEIQGIINHYYNIGAGKLAIQKYRRLLEILNKYSDDYRAIKQYLDEVDKVLDFDGHIIVTHERFLYMSQNSRTIQNHRIIIDEDIIQSVFKVERVEKCDIRRIIQNDNICLNPIVYDRLKQIAESEGMIQFNETTEASLNIEIVEQLNDVSSNVLELLSATEIIADKDKAYYLKIRNFPYKEIVIMSATVCPELYKKLMPNREIEVYHCKEANYTGRIIQYTDKTYSRICLGREEGLIEKLKKSVGEYEVITFYDIERQFETKYHFGGVEGLDILKGRNICVIGMPNISDIVYKLYGLRAGVNSTGMQMKTLRIRHNGYDFSLHTYENEIMRTIQIWCIESLLEQAVGRARLLRYDCEVKVYSGFPVAQAEFAQK